VVWLTVVTITVAEIAITDHPPLQAIFATEAVPFLDGLLIMGVGIAVFAIIETEKQLWLRLRAMRGRERGAHHVVRSGVWAWEPHVGRHQWSSSCHEKWNRRGLMLSLRCSQKSWAESGPA